MPSLEYINASDEDIELGRSQVQHPVIRINGIIAAGSGSPEVSEDESFTVGGSSFTVRFQC